ncbi:unnamed protein product [Lathyrus oleraceus]
MKMKTLLRDEASFQFLVLIPSRSLCCELEVCKLSLFGPMETGLSSWNSWNWLLELGLFCHGSEFCIDGSELLWDLLGIHELLDWLWSVELDLELSSL